MFSWLCFLLFQFCASFATSTTSHTDTLTVPESIIDGQILVSNGSDFALGFFSPGNSSYRYVGIWYYKVSETTVVWVANRDNPLKDSSGVLSFALDGNLVVTSPSNQRRPLWSTNVSISRNTTAFVQLLNSGNLVLYSKMNRILWQSFDHPTHVQLPGMKLGWDWRTGLNRILTSWNSQDDPGHGIYSYGFDPRGVPQIFLYRGSTLIKNSGPWNGRTLSGVPEMNNEYSYLMKYEYVNTTDELYLMFVIYNSSIYSAFVMELSGTVQRMTWDETNHRWNTFYSPHEDECDFYGHCEANGICNMDNQVECACLPGFQPKSPRDWALRVWSEGCVRKRALGCGKGDGFLKLVCVKLPDTSMSLGNKNLSVKECEQECLKNCSCTAYAPADITGGGSGCITWFGNLMDIRYFSDGGQDLYVRVDAVELAAHKDKAFFHKWRVAILTVSLGLGLLLFAASLYCLLKKRKGAIKKRRRRRFLFDFSTILESNNNSSRANELEDDGTKPELPFFEFDVIVVATDNFSPSNRLGAGGFGDVYKGQLSSGKEIAIKRLSKNSHQGMEEFKNEVLLIARLQHRNLVRLLGCCLQEDEKMLIYEYMPNKGLDSFIFNERKRKLLDWKMRFEIIVGIARGVLYLHQDSRLRIIHRDLKASNVLLDEEMNPKISDFGMARIFGGNQIQANTNKVVGTYGYMSPEYAMQGLFSVKSDVFSFGVLLLEIISGKKNNECFDKDPFMNLIGHVWHLWKGGRALEIVDSIMGDSYPVHEVWRCIHVGLLCVQECASDRPTMSSVIFMLGNETNMPPPSQPALILRSTLEAQDSSTTETGSCSINEVTMTEVDPR